MAFSLVACSYCHKNFLKDNRHINENFKLGNNFYCSLECQYSFKDKKIELCCENPNCHNKFRRKPKDISPHNFCSRSCAAAINNVKFPKISAVIRNCSYCGQKLLQNKRKYCSVKCKSNALTITRDKVIESIRNFYEKHGRIPVKREMWGIYKPARKYFGTWNNAIEAAGFEPNPVLFAKRQFANDGHVCDSVAEKIIDDYLFENGIEHKRNIPYPEGLYTADFKVGRKIIEYFGLAGEHKRYDELKKIKQGIAKTFNLQLIEIYPKDLYPLHNLKRILKS